MFLSFLDVLAGAFLVAAALTLVLGLVNHFFDLDLALGVGHQSIDLPPDIEGVIAAALLLAALAGALAAIAHFKATVRWIRGNRLLFAMGVAVALSSVGLAGSQIVGGRLGFAVERNDAQGVKAALQRKSYSPEVLAGYLYQALRQGNVQMADYLLQAGADKNGRRGELQTPLLSDAAIAFPAESLFFLLEKGADPNQRDSLGRTPSLCLVLYRTGELLPGGEDEMITLLKEMEESGADLALADHSGATPLSVAQEWKFRALIAFLQKRTAKNLEESPSQGHE